MYRQELDYFTQYDGRAMAYLNAGNYQMDDDLPINEIAALGRVANTIMNSTESYVKN